MRLLQNIVLLVAWSLQATAVRPSIEVDEVALDKVDLESNTSTRAKICCCKVSDATWTAEGVTRWYAYSVKKRSVSPVLYKGDDVVANMGDGVPKVTCSGEGWDSVLSIYQVTKNNWKIRSCVHREGACTTFMGSHYDQYESDAENFALCSRDPAGNPAEEKADVTSKFGFSPPRNCKDAGT
eukprot:TRINITY_DN12239_c1_g1_i1.p1 TRINITY_DN12239_c1_g1~~TRINITY_DN12239_c1_g1_i1.p1  ORF type:complete len:209 (+),score=23.49 TRINITY_DN12239_c1_g1_i1:83-628(+)